MDIPLHVIVNAGDFEAAKYDFTFIAADDFDDDDASICSLIEETQEADTLSMPSIVKERIEQMSVSTTEDEYEDYDTMDETSTSCERKTLHVFGFCCLNYEDLSLAPQELSYNVTDITCPICHSTADGGEAIALPCCKHAVCVSCFQDHSRASRLASQQVCCPLRSTPACFNEIDQSLVQQIEAMELTEVEEDNYHPCPTLGCSNVVYWKEGNGPPIGDCFKCNTTSCLKCGVTPYHSNRTCLEYLQSRKNESGLANQARWHVIAEERGETNTRRCSL